MEVLAAVVVGAAVAWLVNRMARETREPAKQPVRVEVHDRVRRRR